ncbi:MAG TPA: SMC-Scp complex subunit ScpB [Bacteroidota bacterium]|nr:SMC-Scp complex subunit ScpB [Bacteroidota bacterium]
MIEEREAEIPSEDNAGIAVSPALKEIVEALLFASDEPVTLQTLRAVFDDMNKDSAEGEKASPTNEELRAAIGSLNREYEELHRAYTIQQIAGGYVFATHKKFSTWVGKLFKEKARRKLSQTAVETLAIIAYKQPITKSEVEFIRGVNADYIMKTLLEKNLATIVGRAHSPGRPLLYGTTPEFLKHFGLNEIADLPKPREIEELLGETEKEVEKRMLASQEEIEFKEKLQEKLDPNSRAPHIPRKKSKLQQPPEEEGSTVVEKTKPQLVVAPPPPATTNEEQEAQPAVEAVEPETVNMANDLAVSDATLLSPLAEEKPDEIPPSVTEPSEPALAQPVQFSADIPAERVLDEATELVPPAAPDSAMAEEGPQPLASSSFGVTTGEAITPEHQLDDETGTQKGWSMWKTKIQTFFRKLFG